MSLKPLKKSDRNKKWMQKRKDTPKLMQPERHFIITEGIATEPAYFSAMKKIIDKKYKGKIYLEVYGEGNNTLNLFQKARQEVQKNMNRYRHVWIVYDVDDFPKEQVDKVVQLCNQNSTEETTYHPIWSNQCFEVWYILHFEFLQAQIDRTQYVAKLTGFLKLQHQGEYTKTRRDMYYILAPYMSMAIHNAKKLEKQHTHKSPFESNPGTKVYEIVEKLKPYLGIAFGENE